MNLLIQLGKFRAFFALILTTVIFSTSGSTSARATGSDNWHWRNPLPTGNSLNSVAFGNGLFVAVGPDGNLQMSTDGLTWNAPLPPTTNTLSQVIYANGLYVSVGYNGAILTSPDGVLWTNRVSGTTNNLLAIAYGNSVFVVAGTAGTVLTSTDGLTWAAQNPGVIYDFGWIAFGSGKFMISTPQSTSSLSTLWPPTFTSPTTLISTDGASWTTNTLPLPPNCNGAKVYQFVYANGFFAGYVEINNRGNADDAPGLVRYSYTSTDGVHWNYAVAPFLIPFKSLLAANNLLFQTRYNGFYSNYVSTDGLSWSPISLSNTISYSGLAYGSGKYVLAGAVGAIATSSDGNSWNPVSTGLQTQLTSVASGSNVTVAVGGYFISPTDGTVSGGSASPILVSSNGAPFVSATGPTNLSLTSVAYGATNFVAVGLSGLLERSVDGFNWSVRPSGTTTNLTSICFGNGMWVAVGTGGVIVTSTNSLVWSLRSSTTGENLYGVTYGNGQFVVVGQQGTVLTSPDGINWTLQFDDNVNNLYKVAYGNANFVAVGNAGTIVSSPDGANWTTQTSGVTRPIYGVAYAGGQFVTFSFLNPTTPYNNVGVTTILRSHDGVSWEKLPSPTDWRIIGVTAANGSFWIAGDNGSILQSDVVPAQPILAGRVLPGSGMFSLSAFNSGALNFKVQSRTNPITGIWSDVVSITNSSTTVNWIDTNSTPTSGRFYRIVPP